MSTFLQLLEEILDEPKVEKLDLSKKEDVEKLNKNIEDMKQLIDESPFLQSFIDIFNPLIEELTKELKQKEEEIDEHPETEVSDRPMDNVPEKIKNNITNYAVEYFDTMIYPSLVQLDEKKRKDIIEALTDFGCWLYNK